MPIYKTVVCSLTRKYNLGNYESGEINVFMSGECSEGEDPNEVYTELLIRCKAAKEETERELGLKKKPGVTVKHGEPTGLQIAAKMMKPEPHTQADDHSAPLFDSMEDVDI